MSMKPHLRNLRKGQRVWALVEENIAHGEAIINFSGDLIRVLNLSEKSLRPGQRVHLEVESVRPLKLKLITKTPRYREPSQNLDVTV
jgi:cold shock CspA family protein